MNKIILKFLILLFISSLLYGQIGSEGSFDARSFGMGKTYNAVSKGIFAVGSNPANIFSEFSDKIEISTLLPFPSLSVKGGANFITIDDVNYYFGGVNGEARYLSSDDKQNLMDLFSGGGVVGFNMSINLLMISFKVNPSFGTLALGINDIASFQCTIPSAVPEVALYGNPSGKVYDFSEFELQSWYLRSYSLSYSRKIFSSKESPNNVITAGVTLKYVQGFYYAGTEHVNSSFSTGSSNEIEGNADYRGYSAFSSNFGVKYDFDTVDKESSFSFFPEPAGSGFGFDVGVSASLGENWRLSVSLTDVGKIKWDKNAAQFTAEGTIYIDDLSDDAQRDSLKDKFVGKSKKIDSFETDLPTALRFGITKYFSKSFTAAFDYNLGFNNMPGNSTKGRFSVGVEWMPFEFKMNLRSGFSFGGLYGFGWAAGIGFDFELLEFNIASSDFNSFVVPKKAKYLSVAFDTKWKF